MSQLSLKIWFTFLSRVYFRLQFAFAKKKILKLFVFYLSATLSTMARNRLQHFHVLLHCAATYRPPTSCNNLPISRKPAKPPLTKVRACTLRGGVVVAFVMLHTSPPHASSFCHSKCRHRAFFFCFLLLWRSWHIARDATTVDTFFLPRRRWRGNTRPSPALSFDSSVGTLGCSCLEHSLPGSRSVVSCLVLGTWLDFWTCKFYHSKFWVAIEKKSSFKCGVEKSNKVFVIFWFSLYAVIFDKIIK